MKTHYTINLNIKWFYVCNLERYHQFFRMFPNHFTFVVQHFTLISSGFDFAQPPDSRSLSEVEMTKTISNIIVKLKYERIFIHFTLC